MCGGIFPGVVRLESDYIKSLQLTTTNTQTCICIHVNIMYVCIYKIYFKAIYMISITREAQNVKSDQRKEK